MYVGVGVCLCWEYDYRLLVVFNLRFLSMTRVRYLIAIKYICCMHVCMGIRGMYHHCSRSLVMLSMWMSSMSSKWNNISNVYSPET